MSKTVKEKEYIVKPRTDIVASMASEFKSKLKKLLDKGVTELTIDLDGVEMIDSVGLGVFIATHNSLHNVGGKLCISHASDDLLMLFRTMRLDKHFTVLTPVKEACHG